MAMSVRTAGHITRLLRPAKRHQSPFRVDILDQHATQRHGPCPQFGVHQAHIHSLHLKQLAVVRGPQLRAFNLHRA